MNPARFALVALAFSATAARAQDLCADRPGKGTPACIVNPGAVQIETSLADWSRTDDPGTREDDLMFGDTLVKFGLGKDIELHAAFTAFEHDRLREAGGVDVAQGFGDISLGGRWRAVDGGDNGVSVALQPMLTLPIGNKAVSQGTWSIEIVAPVDLPLSNGWSLNLSPTIAAAADQDGDGAPVLGREDPLDAHWNGRTSIGSVVAAASLRPHSSAASRSGARTMVKPPRCSLPST